MGGGQCILLTIVPNLDRFDTDLDLAFLFDSGSDQEFRNRSLLKVVHKSKEKTKTNYGLAKNHTLVPVLIFFLNTFFWQKNGNS